MVLFTYYAMSEASKSVESKMFAYTISFYGDYEGEGCDVILDDSLVLRIHGVQSLNLEKIALNEKGVFFESVFGYKLVLESNSGTDF